MATYVVSDIHGYYFRFLDLLKKVNFNDNDELYVLGDIIDRGPHNGEMCQWAINQKSNVHFLLGNHEDMMLSVLNGYSYSNNIMSSSDSVIWARNGGYKTYFDLMGMWNEQEIIDFVSWVREWPMFYDINVNNRRFLLVHAGLALNGVRMSDDNYRYGRQDMIQIPDFPDQWAQSLLWVRDNWFYNTKKLPCDVIFGHTPTNFIYENVNLIWLEEDLEFLKNQQGLEFKGEPKKILHINKQKHAIDTGRSIMGMLRLDDMEEFYSDIEEIDEDAE